MNCEKCNELLSDFLDGALSREESAMLDKHFEECLSCFTAHDELNAIVGFCRENRNQYEAPPNERALWLRIRNTIESERGAAVAATARAASVSGARVEHWWTRWLSRSWELSLSQMAMAVSAIVIAVALLTAFSLSRMQNNLSTSNETAAASSSSGSNARGATALSAGPGLNLPVRGITQEIDYWQQRVDERKARWNSRRREDFELNLKVIDQAVQERIRDLRENPHDEMTEEMLNAVLNNKVELLREFSDL
jgi:anti-sigma factor RsiW